MRDEERNGQLLCLHKTEGGSGAGSERTRIQQARRSTRHLTLGTGQIIRNRAMGTWCKLPPPWSTVHNRSSTVDRRKSKIENQKSKIKKSKSPSLRLTPEASSLLEPAPPPHSVFYRRLHNLCQFWTVKTSGVFIAGIRYAPAQYDLKRIQHHPQCNGSTAGTYDTKYRKLSYRL